MGHTQSKWILVEEAPGETVPQVGEGKVTPAIPARVVLLRLSECARCKCYL